MYQYGLFLGLKAILTDLGNPFSAVTYNDMQDDRENVMGIYVRSGQYTRYRELATGQYANKRYRVQFIIQSGRSKDDILAAQKFGFKMEDRLPTVFNTEVALDTAKIGFDDEHNLVIPEPPEEGETPVSLAQAVVGIIRVNPQSGLINVGKTEQGLSRYSYNINVEFYIYEKEAITNG